MKRSIIGNILRILWLAAIIAGFLFSEALAGDYVDVRDKVTVTTSNARSVLDRRTRQMTGTVDVTLTNGSQTTIASPLRVVVQIGGTSVSNVQMPGTEPDTTLYGTYYYLIAAGTGFEPGQTHTFTAKFIYPSTFRITYNFIPYATLPDQNLAPAANAGPDATYTLAYGQQTKEISLDGSGSADSDGNIASYAWSGAPDPADTEKPLVTLGPGTHTFIVVVTDDKGAQSEPDEVTITVKSSNTGGPPELTVTPGQGTVAEGQTVEFHVAATDPDGDVVTLSASPKIENGAFTAAPGQNATGTFTFTPGNTQQGLYIASFKARDSWGNTATKTARITVTNVNHGPTLIDPGPQTVNEGGMLSLSLKASDPDGDALTLSASSLPANAIFIQATGTLTFTPDFNQAGRYTVRCQASDGEQTATGDIEITVNDIPDAGGETGLVLTVDPVQSPTLLTTAQISGTVNGGVSTQPRITSALITGMTPTTARQGETREVVLTGQSSGTFETHFARGVSEVDFGDGVNVNSLTVVSASELRANVSLSAKAEPGLRQVKVITGNETALAMPAFCILQGGVSVTGKLVDPNTGNPISGGIVTIEGTAFSTTSAADGSFSLSDLPSGDYTVIVNAPDHDPMRLELTANSAGGYEMGTISPEPNAFTQSQFPSVSLPGVLSRIFIAPDDRRSLEELEKVVTDAILLVGGRDIGLLDEYGNQLNAHVTETPFFKMKQNAVKTIAMRMKVESPITLGELLFEFTNMWPWQKKPDVLMWVNAIQTAVAEMWSNPFSPDARLFVLLFNNGETLTPDPPVIVPDMPLNALQAVLLRLSLFKMAAQLMDPHTVFELLPDDYFSILETQGDNVFLASRTPGAESNGLGYKLWDKIVSALPIFPREALADDLLVAKAARSKENAWVGHALLLDSTSSIIPQGVRVTVEWSVTAPPGSLGNQQFRSVTDRGALGAQKRIYSFEPDVAGEYTIRLVIKKEDGTQESDPFEISVVARHFPCNPQGTDPGWEDEEVVNLEKPWTTVMCEMATQEAVNSLNKVVDDLVMDDLKTVIVDNFEAIGIDLNFASSGTIAGDVDSRLKTNQMFMDRVDADIKATNKTATTHPDAYEKYLPEAMEASQSKPSSYSKMKGIVMEQLVTGTLSYFQDEADKMGEAIIYAWLDVMVDQLIVSLKPAPPFVQYVEVQDANYDPNKKIVLIVFRRSPDDPGPQKREEGETTEEAKKKSNRYYYYRLWRENRDGLTSIMIGPEGTNILGGPVPLEEGDPNSDLLMFIDPHPEEGINRYYLQTRRVIGKMVPNVTMWNEAEFFFTNYILGEMCPPAAVQYNFSKGLCERAYRVLTETKLQDGDMSAPETVFVPKPFDRPAPIASLAKTPGQKAYMSLPWANAVFEFKGANVIPYFNCGFIDPYQTGFAIDANGFFYAVNSASEAQFGGRIFRWDPSNANREFFGAVNYYSRDLHLAHPSAVQSMVAGLSWGKHGLFLTDLYSGTLRYLDIPATGELPNNDLFHHCTHDLVGAPDINPTPNSSLTIQAGGDVLMTQGDNIFKYSGAGAHGMMFNTTKPFDSLTGIDSDDIGNIYVADSAQKTITAIPRDLQNPAFYDRLKNDPATRSLYTLAEEIEGLGELRVGSLGSALIWFDGDGYNSRQFGISGRLVDNLTGAPVDFAKISCESWGNTLLVLTDANGIFHIPGIRVPNITPPSITLQICDRYSRRMTAVIKSLERHGETFLDPLLFIPEPPPTPSYTHQTTPPPELKTVSIQLPAPETIPGPLRHQPLTTRVDVPHRNPMSEPNDPHDLNDLNGLRAPKIEIVSPVDGLSTKETSIEIYGVVSDPLVTQVQLYINDETATAQVTAGVFKYVATLHQGINAISASGTLTSEGSSASGHSSVNYVEVTGATPQSHCLSGVIVDDETGFPVVNAQVSIQGTGFYAYTDSMGVWFMNGVPTGSYNLDVLP